MQVVVTELVLNFNLYNSLVLIDINFSNVEERTLNFECDSCVITPEVQKPFCAPLGTEIQAIKAR